MCIIFLMVWWFYLPARPFIPNPFYPILCHSQTPYLKPHQIQLQTTQLFKSTPLSIHKLVHQYSKRQKSRVSCIPYLTNNPISVKSKCTILPMYVISILSYADPTWGPITFRTNFQKIEGVKNIGFLTITGLLTLVSNLILLSLVRSP